MQELSSLDHPIKVMYLIHKALRSEENMKDSLDVAARRVQHHALALLSFRRVPSAHVLDLNLKVVT